MPRNVYFSQGSKSEQNLYEDIVIEGLRIYGHDVYYIPRKIVNQDGIFNEATLSEFGESYQIEMYVESVDGYEGDGNLLSKFGLEVRNQVNLVLSRRRWEQLIGRFATSETDKVRPLEGDLIYFPLVKGLFEIKYVDGDTPFYQLQNMPTYKLTCELFEYSNEAIDTGIAEVDTFETQFATRTTLELGSGSGTYTVGEDVTQTDTTGNIVVTGEVSRDYTEGTTHYLDITSQAANSPTANVNGSVSGTTITLDGNVGTLVSGMRVRGTGIADFVTIRTVTNQNSIIVDSSVNLPDDTALTFEHIASNQVFRTTSGTIGNIIGSSSGASYSIGSQDSFKALDINDPSAENEEFETVGNNFIDFSEINPFGEVNIT